MQKFPIINEKNDVKYSTKLNKKKIYIGKGLKKGREFCNRNKKKQFHGLFEGSVAVEGERTMIACAFHKKKKRKRKKEKKNALEKKRDTCCACVKQLTVGAAAA